MRFDITFFSSRATVDISGFGLITFYPVDPFESAVPQIFDIIVTVVLLRWAIFNRTKYCW